MNDREWFEITRRNARSVQTTIGWIFWDPGAVARYDELWAARPARLHRRARRAARARRPRRGHRRVRFDQPARHPCRLRPRRASTRRSTRCGTRATRPSSPGCARHAPAIVDPLDRVRSRPVAGRRAAPTVGRVFFAAHARMPRPDDPLLSAWHAVNCLREWRGDTHWALVAAAGLTASRLRSCTTRWLGYERDWLPRFAGSAPDEIDAAWASLSDEGLVRRRRGRRRPGIALRQHIEDETDRLTVLPWQLLGEEKARAFAPQFEPPCELLLARVDETAGPNYQPASRRLAR